MKYLRATIRLFALTILTGGFYFLRLMGGPRNWVFRTWARGAMRVLGIKLEVLNTPPRAPFILVSNHLSYVDVVVLAAQLDCAFVAKSEVARWPVIGAMCRRMNTVFVDRNRKRDLRRAMARMEEAFESGLGVVLFPEGTSSAGGCVLPFRSSLLEFAASQDLPVHYASISYATGVDQPGAGEAVCWWGEMTFPDHLFRLLQLPGFEARVTFGEQAVGAKDRRLLATRLQAAVSEQLVPVGRRAVSECIDLLEQAAQVLVRIDDGVFRTTTPISPRGSIGGHLRHVLDFYHCFLNGVQDHAIDYNARRRNHPLEHDRSLALDELAATIARLRQLGPLDQDALLLVNTEGSAEWRRSSVSREVDFLKSHTIHHYSLIAMLLRLHEIDPGEEFGVAPSTLRYWREEEAACVR